MCCNAQNNLWLPEHNSIVELFQERKIFSTFLLQVGSEPIVYHQTQDNLLWSSKDLKIQVLTTLYFQDVVETFESSFTDSSIPLFEWATYTSVYSRSGNLLCRFHRSTSGDNKKGAYPGKRWDFKYIRGSPILNMIL